jgi:hypothetical protein
MCLPKLPLSTVYSSVLQICQKAHLLLEQGLHIKLQMSLVIEILSKTRGLAGHSPYSSRET